uniref:M20_dimer domain-containing protein n=1 Tax=Rhabditophanes sp. KR3021 TaxID=114890 RepID=A0AC35TIW0_9BILA
MTDKFEAFTAYIEAHKDLYIERLAEAVAIPSVSADPERRDDVFRMMDHAKKMVESLGGDAELIKNGMETLTDGGQIPLPPVLFASFGKDKTKKTLLVYGHLDVQPASLSDGWASEPFKLVERDGKLFGRGSTDDKGPVLGWLHCVEAMNALNIELPVNIKCVFEGHEESGSNGLEDILKSHKDTFLKDVDFCCISDNYWFGSKPAICYGLRGNSYFGIEIRGPKQDLHSGTHGSSLNEPMTDLMYMMNLLIDVHGKILIEGIYRDVAELTEAEAKLYDNIDFDVKKYAEELGVEKLACMDKNQLVMNRMRNPCLSIHGIEGAFAEVGSKTVIPSKVIGKFSLRTVPNMTIKETDRCVTDYLNKIWAARGSSNKMKIIPFKAGRSWVGDINAPNFKAAERAIKRVHKVPHVSFEREGASIPITMTLEELTGKSTLLLPMGSSDDMAHSQNEKLNIFNYIEGTKVMGAYLMELGQL